LFIYVNFGFELKRQIEILLVIELPYFATLFLDDVQERVYPFEESFELIVGRRQGLYVKIDIQVFDHKFEDEVKVFENVVFVFLTHHGVHEGHLLGELDWRGVIVDPLVLHFQARLRVAELRVAHEHPNPLKLKRVLNEKEVFNEW